MPLDYNAPIPWNGVALAPNNTGQWSPCGVSGIDERYEWYSPDGNRYNLHTLGNVFTLNWQGDGMPPLEYVTQRGAFQDGESVVDVFAKPRVIQLLLRVNCRSRADYWDQRANLLNLLRPNRQFIGAGGFAGSAIKPGALRYYLPNGTVRQLDCVISQGPDFAPRSGDKWDEWSFQEMLRFTAHDPMWYDPNSQLVQVTAGRQLVFPITFPITFQGLDTTVNVMYKGTWKTYPRITISGPVVSPLIQNQTTGELILLNYTLASGRTLVIDLTFGNKSVTLDDGTNLIQYVDKTSDITDFHLEPEPEAFGGINVMRVSGSGAAAATLVTVSWYTRYVGI